MDRVSVRVEFKKGLWTCPKCGQEDFEDFKVAGGNKYEHNCSKCGVWFNSFKEYNGVLSYTPEEYAIEKKEDLDSKKQARMDSWIFSVKNPPPYIEPTPEDLQSEIDSKQEEIESLKARKTKAMDKLGLIGEI